MSSSTASLAPPSENEGGSMKRVVSTADFASTSTPLPKNADVLPFGIAEGDSLNQDNDDFASEANKEIQKQIIQQLSKDKPKEKAVSVLIDILPGIKEGVEAVVKDSFTECFSPKPSPAWNWNIFLCVCWSVGVLIRYCVLLPLRCIVLFLSNLIFAIAAFIIYFMPHNLRIPLQRKAIQLYGSGWLFSLSGVVKYHGVPPVRRPNQIYVANHTSLIDFIILNNHTGFASVGQKHVGVVGFMQNKVLGPLGNIWFERFESRDRRLVAKRINDHISNPANPPLLIFPEGVCVNNEYCVMFKKGVFDIENVEICPIAMKYNKLFSDPYWSSKDENFLQHILRIMKSWCLVCDVWFLEPQKKLPNETSVEFADRVKKMIADKAGLKNLHWDGYLKYYQPTKSMLQEYQKLWADRMKHRWLQILDEDNTEETGGEPEPASASSPKIAVTGEASMRQRKQNTP